MSVEELFHSPENTGQDQERELIALVERRVKMLQHVEEYATAPPEGVLPLYGDQAHTMRQFVDFMQKETPDLLRNELTEPIASLTKSGYILLPCGSGKTIVGAEVLKSTGVGKGVRALWLTYSRQAVNQAVGDVERRQGLRYLVPEASVSYCTPAGKDLSGDVVAMTYGLFLRMCKRGELKECDFDVIVADETHRAMGTGTADALHTYRAGRLLVAMTASPDYNYQRRLANHIPVCIDKAEIPELIEVGRLSNIRIVGLTAERVLQIRETRGNNVPDFSVRELAPLRNDDEYNEAIADMAQYFVQDGLRGIINCAPGNECEHARVMAAKLVARGVRAKAVGRFAGAPDAIEVLRQCRAGELDVVCQVEVAGESFDDPGLGFGIGASPTRSLVKMTQQFGRLLRLDRDDPERTKLWVQVMWRYVSQHGRLAGKVCTPWHVVGAEDYEQNYTLRRRSRSQYLGKKALKAAGISNSDDPFEESEDIPYAVRAMEREFRFTFSKELNLEAMSEVGPPPEGAMSLGALETFAAERHMSIETLKDFLSSNGFPVIMARGSKGMSQRYVTKEALTYLAGYEFPDLAPEDWKCISDLITHSGKSYLKIKTAMTRLKTEGRSYVGRKLRRPMTHFSPADAQRILELLEDREPDSLPQDHILTALPDLEAELGVERRTIRYYLMVSHGIEGEVYNSPEHKQGTTYYDKTATEMVRWHFSHTRIGKGAWTLERLEAVLHADRDTLVEQLKGMGLYDQFERGFFPDAARNYTYTLFCHKDIAGRVKELWNRPNAIVPSSPPQKPVADKEPPSAVPVATPGKKMAVPGSAARRSVPPGRAAERPALTPPITKQEHTGRYELPYGAVELGSVFREVRCDPAVAPAIVRMVAASIRLFKDAEGRMWVGEQAADLIRRRCTMFPVAPAGNETSHAIAARHAISAGEVQAIARSLVPTPTLYGIFRTNDHQGVLTMHYLPSLVKQIEAVIAGKKRS